MKPLFNIFTKLIEMLRLMIIKTLKPINESLLKYFYIEISFSNEQYEFLLPLIAQVKDKNEALTLRTHIIEQIIHINRKNNIGDIKLKPLFNNEVETKKNSIEKTFHNNKYTTIELAFYKIDDTKIFPKKDTISHILKTNVVNGNEEAFKDIRSLFVLEINQTILE